MHQPLPQSSFGPGLRAPQPQMAFLAVSAKISEVLTFDLGRQEHELLQHDNEGQAWLRKRLLECAIDALREA